MWQVLDDTNYFGPFRIKGAELGSAISGRGCVRRCERGDVIHLPLPPFCLARWICGTFHVVKLYLTSFYRNMYVFNILASGLKSDNIGDYICIYIG